MLQRKLRVAQLALSIYAYDIGLLILLVVWESK